MGAVGVGVGTGALDLPLGFEGALSALGVVGFFAKFVTFFNYALNRANIVPILTYFAYFLILFHYKGFLMTNDALVSQLTQLSTNRFALNDLPQNEFSKIYQTLLGCFDDFNDQAQNPNAWVLIGTDGCHLCDKAWGILQTAQTSRPFALYQLDLADSHDERLIDVLGDKIPVLLTPHRLLCYPFGLLDVTFL